MFLVHSENNWKLLVSCHDKEIAYNEYTLNGKTFFPPKLILIYFILLCKASQSNKFSVSMPIYSIIER